MAADYSALYSDGRKRTVAIWNDTWLPRSETFVRDHVESLENWHPATIGWFFVRGGIYPKPFFAPIPFSRSGRIMRRLIGARLLRSRFERIVADPQISLVHAHFGLGGISALPFAKRAGKPLIVTFHGKDVTASHANPAKQRAYVDALSEVFTYASRVIAVSDFIADRLVELGAPRSKIVVSYLGIPISPSLRHEGRSAGILFVGRLVEKKGVNDLIRAVALLPARHKGIALNIVGFGPLRQELENSARKLGVNASFLGALSSEAVASAMASSTLFVGPSQTASDGDAEGFGLVFLEAAAQGAPIVAYNHGGVVEAVESEGNGLIVPEGDFEGLAEAICKLLDDEGLRNRYGKRGRLRVVENFDIQSRTSHLEKIYTDVVNEWPTDVA